MSLISLLRGLRLAGAGREDERRQEIKAYWLDSLDRLHGDSSPSMRLIDRRILAQFAPRAIQPLGLRPAIVRRARAWRRPANP